jgi:hypothetical protein
MGGDYECIACGWSWPLECVCADGGRERPVLTWPAKEPLPTADSRRSAPEESEHE